MVLILNVPIVVDVAGFYDALHPVVVGTMSVLTVFSSSFADHADDVTERQSGSELRN